MARIAIIASSFCRNEILVRNAREHLAAHDVVFRPLDREVELASFLADTEGVIVGRERFDAALLARLPALRAIAKYGVGLDNIDLDACRRRGVAVHLKPGVNADSVAELALGLMLGVMRNIGRCDRAIREDKWWRNGGRQLTGKTVAIIGCGAIGSRVARLARAFSCAVVLRDIIDKSELAAQTQGRLVSFEEALAVADVVTIHVPLTPQTRGMMDKAAFARMPRGAVFINTSRGSVVDEEALAAALSAGHLGGAGLDVFVEEPPQCRKLVTHPAVISTAHIGGNSLEAVEAMGMAAIEALEKHFG